MRKMRWIVLVLAVLASACRAEATVQFDLLEDGSGTYLSEVGIDDDLRETLTPLGDPSELLSSLDFGLPGTVINERREGDMTFTTVSGQFSNVAEITDLIDNSDTQTLFDEFEMSVDENGARVNALIVLPEQLTRFADQAAIFDADSSFSASIVITLPGRITLSNATRSLGDNRLQWELALTDTEIDIEAASTFKENGFPWWIVIVALLAAAGLAGWWWWSQRKRQGMLERLSAAEADRQDAIT